MLQLLWCCFALLRIQTQKTQITPKIQSVLSFTTLGPYHKMSLQSIHNFLSNVHRQRNKLEALRERRPPWPRQIITPILSTVKMLSLGCERLPTPLKKKKKKKGSGSLPSPRSGYATTITVFFCSFTHLTIPRSPPKFNQFLLVLLRTRP